ncbi:hypothetical protein EWB00_010633 [Schistosoma japonicum]|uniref:Uncharacterized protein n=1 Tax=Schistosoma japonicum TaxID=6182 RepID=A0A4Z2DMY9_SCHJA|nr:hypothetical protein EWB00_010633 [Schistosoma japonicum]
MASTSDSDQNIGHSTEEENDKTFKLHLFRCSDNPAVLLVISKLKSLTTSGTWCGVLTTKLRPQPSTSNMKDLNARTVGKIVTPLGPLWTDSRMVSFTYLAPPS